jgi:DNA-binding NarL/FixJ family response regulator
VLVADDHPIVRLGLTTLFDANDDFDMVGEATTGQEAVDMCGSLNPEVVLMDLSMPVMNGIDATEIIFARYPRISVIMFSGSGDLPRVSEAIGGGARGFIRKSAALGEIMLVIRTLIQSDN